MNDNPMPTQPARDGNSAFAISIGLLMLRLALGTVFIYHGGQKAFGFFGGDGLEAFAGNAAIKSMPGLPPMVWAAMAAYGEFFGGLGVLLGLLTRAAVLPIMASMFVAIAQHGRNGLDFLDHGYEYNLVLIGVCTMLLLGGGGLVSADAYVFRRGFWSHGAQPLST
jgi:putative oxidoreductase